MTRVVVSLNCDVVCKVRGLTLKQENSQENGDGRMENNEEDNDEGECTRTTGIGGSITDCFENVIFASGRMFRGAFHCLPCLIGVSD